MEYSLNGNTDEREILKSSQAICQFGPKKPADALSDHV
jgi:hypothetical protein